MSVVTSIIVSPVYQVDTRSVTDFTNSPVIMPRAVGEEWAEGEAFPDTGNNAYRYL
ncbi:MAG: hypothetical protein P8Y03_24235 [Anaerolineales bacterium]|jgi:hypothetical protein